MNNDKLILGGHEFNSRFILGSGKYSLNLIEAAIKDAGAEIITLAVRRANTKDGENILDFIPKNVTLLPNTSGARNAKEAVRIAKLARELGCGNFVKVEIMRDSKYLLPDNQETIIATETLANDGFVVLPYMYPDLNVARDLVSAGAAAVMPLASPIGSNKGLATKDFIQILIDEGKHRSCNRGRFAINGGSLPSGNRGRQKGVSLGLGQSAHPRRFRFRSSDGISA